MSAPVLRPEEKLLATIRYQWLFVFSSFGRFLATILTLGLYAYLYRRSNVWVITNRRLVRERGILARDTVEMELGRVAQVETYSGLFDRMIGVGRIRVIALDQFQFEMSPVPDPDQIKNLLMNAVAETRRAASGGLAAAPAVVSPKDEALAALVELGKLKESGVLTDAEFQTKKRELLARI